MIVALALWSCKTTEPVAAPVPVEPPPDPAKVFVDDLNRQYDALYRENAEAHWLHETDITDEHEAAAAASDEKLMAFTSAAVAKAAEFTAVSDPVVARSLHLLKVQTTLPPPKDPALQAELAKITTGMSSAYGKGEWCPPGKKAADGAPLCLDLGQIEKILAESDDEKELRAAWEGWHRVAVPIRPEYTRFVELSNQGAKDLGYANTAELWKSGYDLTPAEFEAEVDRLWSEVKPLYDQLHCYTRNKLSKKYGTKVVPKGAPIPAHLTGNMWAQDWAYLAPDLVPFPKEVSNDPTKALVEQKWDDQKMTKTAENFFVSLGMAPLPESFWTKSMFVQPPGKEAVCHASAWDFAVKGDLRLKMCIEPNYDNLVTLHHELGHLYYDQAYQDEPYLFRAGANDGFHEAIGDTIALSMTPKYLNGLGLVPTTSATREAVINEQMNVALGKIAFLPFGLLVDKWRWQVFDGRLPPEKYNEGWWALRKELQGVAPPSPRDETAFDAGAKYHVPANTPYMRYFLAHVLQFQFHRALCEEAGWTGPLHECSIYDNKAAGAKFQAMLAMGASRPWPDALEAATGERKMDATAVVDYFAPLMGWLQEQNAGQQCGW
jgi:peptidyl-dipeptidase A